MQTFSHDNTFTLLAHFEKVTEKAELISYNVLIY